jgi:neutral amino acid transport system substrate-binding protein
VEPDACETNSDCRTAFGWGFTCGENGFCEQPDLPARCDALVPEDLFEDPARYRNDVVIGALWDGVAHLDSIQASRLAVLEVNRAGALDDQDFALVMCDYGESPDDDLGTAEASAEGARWLADVLGTSAIAGPRGSSRTEAAFLALDGRDVVLISPSATSPTLTLLDETMPTDEKPGLLWRTIPPDDRQAEVIVGDLAARGVGSLAIITQEGSYGDALTALVANGWDREIGGPLSVFSYVGTPFGAVADAAEADPDEVVFISSEIGDYVDFLDGAVASDNLLATYDGIGILLTDPAFNVQLLENVGEEATVLFDNVRGTRPAPASGALFDTFSAAFAAEYGADPQSSGVTVHSYDATYLLFYAHAWARFNEEDSGGLSLARGLRRLSAGMDVPIRESSWIDVRDAFSNGISINIAGGSGELDYDPATEETSAPIQVWGIAEPSPGEFEFFEIEILP